MKSVIIVLVLMTASITSCQQRITTSDQIQTESPDSNGIVKSDQVLSKHIYTKYKYADTNGENVIVENSFPKGGAYIDSTGKKYPYAVFWTRIVNESANPLVLTIDFPLEPIEIPSLSGNFMNLLLPSDTMTIEKEDLYDYGLMVQTFIDSNGRKSSSMNRTINPKSSYAFYVVTLSNHGVNGTLRTGFSLKDQNIFYRINGKEILCGKINLKNLILQR